MSRREIKENAKNIIKGKKWLILKPLALIFIINFIIGFVSGLIGADNKIVSLISDICSLITSLLGSAYYVYLLKIVRTGDASLNDVIECFKAKWLDILLVTILVAIFTFLWSLLFIIPGIIASYAYAWSIILVVDKEMKPREAIKESKRMMKGYKLDYFIFELSFFGWALLSIFTLGILWIWLVPYMSIANILYYEELNKKYQL